MITRVCQLLQGTTSSEIPRVIMIKFSFSYPPFLILPFLKDSFVFTKLPFLQSFFEGTNPLHHSHSLTTLPQKPSSDSLKLVTHCGRKFKPKTNKNKNKNKNKTKTSPPLSDEMPQVYYKYGVSCEANPQFRRSMEVGCPSFPPCSFVPFLLSSPL